MKEEQISIGFIGGLIIKLLIFTLLLVIFAYITKLEKIGCECATHPSRDFIKSYTIISIIFMLFSGFVSIRNIYDNFGETIATLYQILEIIFYLIFVVYIYMTFDYVRYLINEKCKCSEGISRDVIMIGTIIELFLFLIIFLTGIAIPIITEGASSLINNIGKFKDDIKENIDDPLKSAINTPNKIRKSAKDISKLLKKSVKDLKRISKPSIKSKGSRR